MDGTTSMTFVMDGMHSIASHSIALHNYYYYYYMIAIIIALCRCLEYNSVLACTVYYVGYVLCNLYTVEMFNAKVHSNCEFLFKKKSDNIEADLMIAYYRNEIGNKQTIAV